MQKENTETFLSTEAIVAKMKKDREVHWYGLRVSLQHERRIVEQLKNKGIEAFVPLSQEKHRWSDRMKMVDKVLTPRLIFVRISMNRKNEVFIDHNVKSYVYAPGDNRPTPIPDDKMRDFMRIVDAFYKFEVILLIPGDDVMVLDGPLKGLVGTLVKYDGSSQLIVKLNDVFGAAIRIDFLSVKKVPKGTPSIPPEQVK